MNPVKPYNFNSHESLEKSGYSSIVLVNLKFYSSWNSLSTWSDKPTKYIFYEFCHRPRDLISTPELESWKSGGSTPCIQQLIQQTTCPGAHQHVTEIRIEHETFLLQDTFFYFCLWLQYVKMWKGSRYTNTFTR